MFRKTTTSSALMKQQLCSYSIKRRVQGKKQTNQYLTKVLYSKHTGKVEVYCLFQILYTQYRPSGTFKKKLVQHDQTLSHLCPSCRCRAGCSYKAHRSTCRPLERSSLHNLPHLQRNYPAGSRASSRIPVRTQRHRRNAP